MRTVEGNHIKPAEESLDNLSSAEIDDFICRKEIELKEAISTNEVVEQEIMHLQKQIIQHQLVKKELEMKRSKSHANIKTINADLRIARSKFWAIKNEGR